MTSQVLSGQNLTHIVDSEMEDPEIDSAFMSLNLEESKGDESDGDRLMMNYSLKRSLEAGTKASSVEDHNVNPETALAICSEEDRQSRNLAAHTKKKNPEYLEYSYSTGLEFSWDADVEEISLSPTNEHIFSSFTDFPQVQPYGMAEIMKGINEDEAQKYHSDLYNRLYVFAMEKNEGCPLVGRNI